MTATTGSGRLEPPVPLRRGSIDPLVVVVEADAAIRQTLVALLGQGVVSAATLDDLRQMITADQAVDAGGQSHVGPGSAHGVVVVAGPSLPPPVAASGLSALASSAVSSHGWRTAIVGVTHRCTTRRLRDALSVGLDDLVSLDAGPTQLRHAVRRAGLALAASPVAVSPPVASPLDDGPTAITPLVTAGSGPIAVFAPKGGAGASTVAANVAVGLAARSLGIRGDRWRYPGVIVDADLQFGDQALMLGIDPITSLASLAPLVSGRPATNVAGEHEGGTTGTDAYVELLITHRHSGVAVLCAPVDPVLADTVSGALVMDALRAIDSCAPWVVVDLPSHIDDLTMDVLDASSHLLVVTATDPSSVKDVRAVADTLARLGVAPEAWTLVCNGVGAADSLSVAQIEHYIGVRAGAVIPLDPAIPAALARGNPVTLEFPQSPSARAVADLVDVLTTTAAPGAPRDGVSSLAHRVDRSVQWARSMVHNLMPTGRE
jgi:MinD-like ATPase involved in chromosome partitioning or flagellar assembly